MDTPPICLTFVPADSDMSTAPAPRARQPRHRAQTRSECLLSARLRSTNVTKRRKVKLNRCPHCNQMLAPKTYKKHKRLYVRLPENVWIADEKGTEGECIIPVMAVN